VNRRAKFGIALVASVVGCGDRIGTAPDDAAGSSKEAGNSPEDGASVRRLDGGSPPVLDATSFDGDAPSPISWDGRAPEDHRASATDCPQQRDEDAGTACAASWPPDPGEYACAQDSDCTMGANGRCLGAPSPPPYEAGLGTLCESFCSYDQCFVDSDCGPRLPCLCRDASYDGAPNLCLTESNCAIDSQCGPPGFCSPSSTFGEGSPSFGYFCHTLNDLCVDDTDCAPLSTCQFDDGGDRWICYPTPTMR